MWDKIVVGAVVLIAAAWVAWRFWRTLSGRRGCNCSRGSDSSSCPMAPTCNDPQPPETDAPDERGQAR